MENVDIRAELIAKKQEKHRKLRRIISIPAAIIVFVTTYMLVMPAFTQSHEIYCGLEEHAHTEECYIDTLTCGYDEGDTVVETETVRTLDCTLDIHRHTADCYDSDNELVCGYADFVVHKHDSSCYDGGTLICSLEEIEEHEHTASCYETVKTLVCGQNEIPAHTHSDSCYTTQSETKLVCGQNEIPAHTHADSCYTVRTETNLTCGQNEYAGHTHSDSCYNEEGSLICGQDESAGHAHSGSCYTTTEYRDLTCGKAETEGHAHTAACYETTETTSLTCAKEETKGHTHSDACYETEEAVTCGKDEVILHTHNKNCFKKDSKGNDVLICTELEVLEHDHSDCWVEQTETREYAHEHMEDCYGEPLVICGMEAHTHDDRCFIDPEEQIADDETEEPEPETTAEPWTEEESEAEDEPEATDETDDTASEAAILAVGMGLRISDVPTATLANGSGIATILASGYQDMGDYLDIVVGTGTTNTRPNVYETDLKFQFTIPADALSRGNKFELQLPEGVSLANGMLYEWKKVYDSATGELAFEYEFVRNADGTYSVLVEFDPDYVAAHPGAMTGRIGFHCSMELTADNKDHKFQFGNSESTDLEIEITEEEEKSGLTVEKYLDYNKGNEDGLLYYTVKVTSKLGTDADVVLEDIMKVSAGSANVSDLKNMKVVKKTISYATGAVTSQTELHDSKDDPDRCGNTYTMNSSGDGKFNMTLPQMKANNNEYWEYEITYCYEVSDFSDGQVAFLNTATGRSKGDADFGDANKWVNEKAVNKSGYKKMNGEEVLANHWTITVNGSTIHDNVNGWVLTDDALSQFTPDDIGTKLIITPDRGYTYETVNGHISKIIFTEDPNRDDGQNRNKYTIEYDTPADQTTNTANVEDPNGPKHDPAHSESTGGRGPGGNTSKPGDVYKEFVSEDKEKNGEKVLHWTVEIAPNDKGVIEGTYEEHLWYPEGNGQQEAGKSHWITIAQIKDLMEQAKRDGWYDYVEWQVVESSGHYYVITDSYDGGLIGYREDQAHYADRDTQLDDSLKFPKFKLAFKDGGYPGRIVFDYATTIDATIGGNFYNEFGTSGRIEYPNIPNLPVGVEKTSTSGGEDLTGDGSVTEINYNSNTHELSWQVKVTLASDRQKLVVTDHLPAGVKLKDVSLTILGNHAVKSPGEDYYPMTFNWDKDRELWQSASADKFVGNPNKFPVDNNGNYKLVGAYLKQEPHGDHMDIVLYDFPSDMLDYSEVFTINYTVEIDQSILDELEKWDSDDPLGELRKSFMNVVQVEVDDKNGDSARQTTDIVKRKNENLISKDVDYNDPIVKYHVDINVGTVVTDDFGNELDYIELVDVLTYDDYPMWKYEWDKWDPGYKQSFSLIDNTVKLYKATVDPKTGELVSTGEEIPIEYWIDNVENEPCTKPDHSEKDCQFWTHTITVRIPNTGEPMIFEYAYQATTELNQEQQNSGKNRTIKAHNQASLLGRKSSSDDSERVWEDFRSDGDITSAQDFLLSKRDEENYSKALANAVFGIFECNANGDPVGYPDNPVAVTDANGNVTELVTNANGEISLRTNTTLSSDGSVKIVKRDGKYVVLIQDKNHDASNEATVLLSPNKLYCFMEISPPDGYELHEPQNPLRFYYSEDGSKPSGWTAKSGWVNLAKTYGSQRVTNPPTPEPVYYPYVIYKTDGETGKALEGVTFSLHMDQGYDESGSNYRMPTICTVTTGTDGTITMTPRYINGKYYVAIEPAPVLEPGPTGAAYDASSIQPGLIGPFEQDQLYYWIEDAAKIGYKPVREKNYFWFDEDGSFSPKNGEGKAVEGTNLLTSEGEVPISVKNFPLNYSYELLKTGDDSGHVLPGTKFHLYTQDKNGNSTSVFADDFVTDKDGKISIEAKVVESNGAKKLEATITDANGEHHLTLDLNTPYYWVETEPPSTGDFNYKPTDEKFYFWFLDGETGTTLESFGYTLLDGANVKPVEEGAKAQQHVINYVDTDYELPETGGAGTILYTLAGMLMIFSAGAVYSHLQSKRRGVGTAR